MRKQAKIRPRKYQVYTSANLDTIPQLHILTNKQRMAIKAVAAVLPFRVNNYVIEELIDWNNIPDDPMFQLSFPQEEMLHRHDFNSVYKLQNSGTNGKVLKNVIEKIQAKLNPHPSGQMELNVPFMDGRPVPGVQHKYRETILFFPSQGQTCHTYCTYCFRWAQFIGNNSLKFASNEAKNLVRYVKKHPEVRDILITGGDPMIMKANLLRRYIEPLLDIESVHTIRIGTKSVAWWPYRFVTEPDTDDVLRLFEDVVAKGKHMALMAHYSHPRELSTPIAAKAIQRIRATGAEIRCQAPLIRHVNDQAHLWAGMWQRQVDLGAIPYYMFVERDTGAKNYFEVPLHKAYTIFTKAYQQVSGLGRTVRGPVMSATPGKVLIEGIANVAGKKAFVLKLIQGRDPSWANQVFFAKYDEKATWLDHLQPLTGRKFFFGESKAPHHSKINLAIN